MDYREPLPARPRRGRAVDTRHRPGRLLPHLALLLMAMRWVSGETPDPGSRAVTGHWAFQPARRGIQPPPVRNAAWCINDLDRFVLARFEAHGLQPAPAASPRALLRRLTQDLTGLPPGSEAVEEFEREFRAGAGWGERIYRRRLEELLASPAYGERQARHWLDIARYADTKGYVYAREERTFVHGHVYRDWVIRAFNADLPYDRFVALQIAADHLVPPGAPDLAALGFITLGRRFLSVAHDIIDDRIDVVTRGTMALTVQCARCHDHKFDPVPIRDYYSLYGVFRSSTDRLVGLGPEPSDPEYLRRKSKLAEKMRERRAEVATRARARAGDYLAAQLRIEAYPEEGFDEILGPEDLNPALVRRWRDWLHTATRDDRIDSLFGPWAALRRLAPETFAAEARKALDSVCRSPDLHPRVAALFATPPVDLAEAAARYAALFREALASDPSNDPGLAAVRAFLHDPDSPCTVPDTGIVDNDQFFTNDVREELWKLQSELDRWLIGHPESPHVVALGDRPPGPNPRVFKRGNPGQPGDEVPRQFLEVLAGPQRQPFRDGSGRRELAEAIVAPTNPLTARVAVNRVWARHFGTGLVRTTSDFGLRADPPSDPELLDWLADRFVASGWSLKALHRLICESATYRQQAMAGDAQPGDATLAHARVPLRRLDFEQLRDAVLHVTGELDPRGGGAPVDNFASGNTRRTVYGLVDRQFLPATLRLFDFPHPDVHVSTRHETTVPQQALFLLNHEWLAARARALAASVAATAPTAPTAPAARIEALYRRVFQRAPSERERAAGLRYLATPLLPPTPTPPPSDWTCGYGEYDEALKRVKSFTPLPHFTGDAWQGGPAFPDVALGWVQLTPRGGHPGNDRRHACIRRWTAPRPLTVRVSGELRHEVEAGDGVRAFIVSSRHGELRAASVHQARTPMEVATVELATGDTLDFVVHIGNELNSDQHLWAPTVQAASGDATWDAERDFPVGPPTGPNLLAPWEQYAQVLLLSNEFSHLD